MRELQLIAVSLAAFMISGCSTYDISEFAELENSLNSSELMECDLPPAATTGALGSSKIETALSTDQLEIGETISPLRNTKALDSLLGVYDNIGNRVGPNNTLGLIASAKPVQKNINLSAGDFKEFGKTFASTVLNPNVYLETKSASAASGRKRDVTRVFKAYYREYISGKFVDRFGAKLSKPDIKKGIGSDVIGAVLLVFMEALADTKLRTPIFFKKKGKNLTYYPSGAKDMPTAAKVKIGGDTIVKLIEVASDSTVCGITEKEAKSISFISNLAGDKAATLNKLILESFGDIELSFIIGGHFSVGDNETLATIFATFFESVSRRGSERMSYEFFWKFTYIDPSKAGVTTVTRNPKLAGVEKFVLEF